MKKIALIVVALFIAGAIGIFAARTTQAPAPALTQAAEAANFLVLSLPDLAGKPQPFSQWAGRVLVLNYWATWCPPCRQEMPMFSMLHERYAAQGVQFVGISIDTADKVSQFQQESPVAYPLLIAPMNALAPTAELGNATQGLPFTLVLDRQGHIAASKLGRFSESDLERLIKQLL